MNYLWLVSEQPGRFYKRQRFALLPFRLAAVFRKRDVKGQRHITVVMSYPRDINRHEKHIIKRLLNQKRSKS